jgi:hypothetical protein
MPWTGAVDPVHRSTVDRSKGYVPDLIWTVCANRMALAIHERRAAVGGWRAAAPAAERRRLAGGGPNGAPLHHFRRRAHGEEEEEEGKLTGGLEGRKGGRKRRSTWRLRRRAVLRRPFGAAVLRGCVGAEEVREIQEMVPHLYRVGWKGTAGGGGVGARPAGH